MSSLHLIGQDARLLVSVTVRLEEDLWQERFPNHHKVVDALKELGHSIRFGVDAKQARVSKQTRVPSTAIECWNRARLNHKPPGQVDCANYSMIVFNFPAVSAQEVPRDDGGKLSASGELALGFLMNARVSWEELVCCVLRFF